ncbi:MAG: PilZ domain-containing protein [Deltaproteobacteria bacterium]|jgi:c-di-GMP-binding flagellar brake protein YcgR|nr:PilZ domain-containing protein [Deltaproteobacteria bacterium]MDR2387278.1 PilZ domain-containing protein [Deltaproteobacteria bacterium]
MSSNEERRKGLRATLPTQMLFNVLDKPNEYIRGQDSTVKRLANMDSEPLPQLTSASQILLSRIDRKLSLILSILAETTSRKNYTNQAMVQDISEFGLSFGHNSEFPIGMYLEIGLCLPYTDGRLMDIMGRIVRILDQEENLTGDPHVYGFEFTDVLSSDQNEIVQWIFTKQREEIRRRRERG